MIVNPSNTGKFMIADTSHLESFMESAHRCWWAKLSSVGAVRTTKLWGRFGSIWGAPHRSVLMQSRCLFPLRPTWAQRRPIERRRHREGNSE
jgi:hypothetical protein